MKHISVLGAISIAVIASTLSSARADDLDARLAALEQENAALRKQLRIRELEKKNAALREQLRSTSPIRPKIAAPARPRPAAKRGAAKPEGLAAIASALTYAPLANPPYAAKNPAPLDAYPPVARGPGGISAGMAARDLGAGP